MTGAELMILGKLALTFSVLLGVPLWQLVSVRRALRAARHDRPGHCSR